LQYQRSGCDKQYLPITVPAQKYLSNGTPQHSGATTPLTISRCGKHSRNGGYGWWHNMSQEVNKFCLQLKCFGKFSVLIGFG